MNNKNYADISVIIPCYNSYKTIERALNSVVNQSLLPREIILVDDCSTYKTLELLNNFKKNNLEYNIIILSLEKNVGAASARNRAWDIAKSYFIAFLDSDDSWNYRKLEIQYTFMMANPHIIITGHDCEILDNNSIIKNDDFEDKNFYNITKYKLLFSNKYSTPTIMLKRDIKFRFPENQRYAEDYYLWLEILLSGGICYKSDLKLAYLYKASYGESGLSSNLWDMEKGELNNFKVMYKKKYINLFEFLVVYVFSLLKYLRRVVKVKLNGY